MSGTCFFSTNVMMVEATLGYVSSAESLDVYASASVCCMRMCDEVYVRCVWANADVSLLLDLVPCSGGEKVQTGWPVKRA